MKTNINQNLTNIKWNRYKKKTGQVKSANHEPYRYLGLYSDVKTRLQISLQSYITNFKNTFYNVLILKFNTGFGLKTTRSLKDKKKQTE